MRKLFISLALSLLMLLVFAVPTFAVPIVGVHYDLDADENEPALTIDWSGRNKPDSHFMAGEFVLSGSIKTIADLEEWVEDEVALVIVKVESINDYPEDDPVRADPPELAHNQEIIGNKVYTHRCYFRIHIYSIDDSETPESELRFITRLSIYEIPDDWWQH